MINKKNKSQQINTILLKLDMFKNYIIQSSQEPKKHFKLGKVIKKNESNCYIKKENRHEYLFNEQNKY